MGEVNKTKTLSNSDSSYTDFFYYFFRNILLVSVSLVIISAIILSSLRSSATSSGSGTDNLTITISSACTLSSVVDIEHSTNTNVGTYTSDIGRTTITTLCNDGNGYSVYATGYSNNEEGNNRLINTEYPQYSINTGLATSGLTSTWAMKLNNIENDPSPTPPTIESDYNNAYGMVPPYWTKVASRASGTTDMAQGSSFTTTYAVYASSSQYAGTYQGQVKYMLVHPSSPSKNLTMQSIATWKDVVLPNEGDSVQAVDERDGKKYWVTKLKDGNIWMTQNLDLEIDTTRTYTHNDTDLGWDPNSFDSNATWKPDTTNGRYNLPVNGTSVPGWSNQNNYPYSADPGDVYYYTSNSEANDIKYNSLSECIAANHTEGECKHYHAGNYYNWTAAIASNNSSSLIRNTINDISKNPKNSICPKGWRLPTISSQSEIVAGSTNEFGRLNYLYNNNSITADDGLIIGPLWLTKSGCAESGNESCSGKGYYWSSTAGLFNNTTPSAYMLGFGNGKVNPITIGYEGRYYGMSVRCVAR